MEKFIVDYRIPPNVGLRHCEEREWHFKRNAGEVVIPLLAFIEGGVRILMGPVLRDYLRHFRLAPFSGYLHSMDEVQLSHLSLPGSMLLFPQLK